MSAHDDDGSTEEAVLAYSDAIVTFMKKFPDHDVDAFMNHVVQWAYVCKVNGTADLLDICDAPYMRACDNHEEELDKFILSCDAYPPLKTKPQSRLRAYARLSDVERTEEALYAAIMHDLVYGLTKEDCK
jgi:hypothetical protein